MNTTPMNTATAAGAAAVIAPVVAYAATAMHLDLPAPVQAAIVVGIVSSSHWAGAQIGAFGTQISDYLAAKTAAAAARGAPVAPTLAPAAPATPVVVNVSTPTGVSAAQVAQAVQQAVAAAPAQP